MSDTVSYPPIGAAPLTRSRRWAWVIEHRWLLLAFAILLTGATGIRLLTFDRYLPYLDYADENNMYLLGRDWRGVEDVPVIPEWLAGYPPLYVWFNIGVQQTVETFWTRPWLLISDYFFYLRLLAAIAGVITTLLVVSIGWQLGGALAGWLAGLVWGFAPIIVEYNNLAIPDPMVFLACAATITMALRAWKHDSPRWLMGSLLAAIAALYLKYPAIYALVLPGIVTLMLLYRQPRRMLPWLAAMLVIALLAGAYLLFDYGSFRLSNREADTVRDSFLDNMLNPDRNFNNWYYAIYPVGMGVFGVSIIAGIAAYFYSRRQGWRTLNPGHITLLLVYGIAAIMITSTFTNVWLGAGKIRHVLPTSLAVIAVWGTAVAQIVWTVQRWVSERTPNSRREWLVPAGALALLGVVLLPGFITGNVSLVQRFRQTSVQEQLWRWTDVNIPVDGMVLADPASYVAHTWNRPWSGYDGVKTFLWWLEDQPKIEASTPEQYVERGITFFVMDAHDRAEYAKSPAAQAFINQLTLVKVIHAPPIENQFDAYFYRMFPPQHAADALFGGQITFAGYDLSGETAAPGDTLHLRPYWRAPRRPDTNYSMFVHLYPTDSDTLITQHDGAPTVPERPTLTWDDPDELYFGADVNLTIPADTAPGDYQLAIGLYDYSNGARLTLPDGSDKFTLPITITSK
jgi:4-amino-4-deoxy-L-arabinose transferase-like glycosyltransferase